MRNLSRKFILLLFLFLGVLKTNAQEILTIADQLADYDYLIEELRKKHQGLYYYTEKAPVDRKIDSIKSTISQEATTLEFYLKVKAAIALTNEGHTSAALDQKTLKWLKDQQVFLPLYIEFVNQKAVVHQHSVSGTTNLKRASRIIAIDGLSIDEIMGKFSHYFPTDGFIKTSVYEYLYGTNFLLYYHLLFGSTDQGFQIKFQNYGSTETYIEQLSPVSLNYFIDKDNRQIKDIPTYSFYQYEMNIIGDSIAHLCIPGFNIDEKEYGKWLRKNFTEIKNKRIKHLIIDIQANRGGMEGEENLLASYLIRDPFIKYKEVTVLANVHKKFRSKKDFKTDKYHLTDSFFKRGDFTIMSNYFGGLPFKSPTENLIFDGNVYVLISGRTFSGGAEFASMMKMKDRAVFIGEETGGAYEGNVSGENEEVILPSSNISVFVPIVHFKLDVLPTIKGRGIMPDHLVPKTWEAYEKGTNIKLDFTLELIKEKN